MNNERFSKEQLEKYLNKKGKVFLFDEIGSTNAEAKRLAALGEEEFSMIVAQRQTAGRGRLGRSFFSPDGGIYFSLVLRPSIKAEEAVYITVAAAVAVAQTIEKFAQKQCLIKWVNDIYIEGKKVCGILTEGVFGGNGTQLDSAILGIGINLTEPENGYPQEIADRAAAVFGKRQIGGNEKAKLVADIVNGFSALYSDLKSKGFLAEYRRRSYLDGKTVEYELDGKLYSAKVKGIDENARIILERDGKTVALSAGDVSVRPEQETEHE